MPRVRRDIPPVPPFHRFIAFSSIDPARNRARYYRLALMRVDARWALVSYRGRVGGTQQVLIEMRASFEEAMELAVRRAHDRLLHGYAVVAVQ